MKKIVSLAIFLISTLSVSGQVVGKIFPDMITETVDDKKINLPQDVKGKFTLLGLAFSKKSENDLNTWLNPVFEKFINKSTGIFASTNYNINLYIVPMFTGINAAATGTAKNKALKNVDKQLLPYILFYKGELKKYRDELNFDRKDVPYFFVLDPNGKIVYATDGSYSDEKMEAIEAAIEN